MNAVTAIEPWQGKVVEGKYPLLELIGTGSRGPVFRTELRGPNGPLPAAIKLIPVEPKNAESELSRLRAVMALSHPNLIRMFEAGRCEIRRQPNIYVVMEFAEENLGQVLPSRALSATEVEQMLPPLIDVLKYLHGKGFVHGRVQPSNILAVRDTLKLSSDCIRQATGNNLNQPYEQAFASPESAIGALTPASDVWSVGATIVASLAGGASNPRMVPDSLPEPLRGIARECLRLDPSERCTLAQIEAWLNAKQAPAARRASAVAAPNADRKPIRQIGIVAGVILLLAITWFALSSRSKAPQTAVAPKSAESTTPSQAASEPATSQGSVSGAVAERTIPNVSQGARNTIHGKIRVSVRVSVDASGKVTDARLTSAGPSRYFANQALQSARQWKFTPPQVNGQPSTSAWLLKYQFGRGGTDVSPAEIH